MLFTAGFEPVAHEFVNTGDPGSFGSEFSPVRAEWPIATSPTGPAGAALEIGVDRLVLVFDELAVLPPQAATAVAATARTATRHRPALIARSLRCPQRASSSHGTVDSHGSDRPWTAGRQANLSDIVRLIE